MLALMTLFALMTAGVVCLAVFVAVMAVFKVTVHAIIWPLKLLLLPFLLVALVVKLALVLTLVVAGAALLIPLAILGLLAMLFVGPFLLLGALT